MDIRGSKILESGGVGVRGSVGGEINHVNEGNYSVAMEVREEVMDYGNLGRSVLSKEWQCQMTVVYPKI